MRRRRPRSAPRRREQRHLLAAVACNIGVNGRLETSIDGRGVQDGSERRATAGWHARESMWLQSTEIRVRTGACGYFRVPHGRPGRTRVKCEPSQVDTGREPRGESDVRDGRHICDGCGERDHMRERPQMHVHRESDSRERRQMHTERRVVSVVGARVQVYTRCCGHAGVERRVSVPLRAIMSDERPRHATRRART